MEYWPPHVQRSALNQAREWQAILSEWVAALKRRFPDAAPVAAEEARPTDAVPGRHRSR
jgi:hypothetical protein